MQALSSTSGMSPVKTEALRSHSIGVTGSSSMQSSSPRRRTSRPISEHSPPQPLRQLSTDINANPYPGQHAEVASSSGMSRLPSLPFDPSYDDLMSRRLSPTSTTTSIPSPQLGKPGVLPTTTAKATATATTTATVPASVPVSPAQHRLSFSARPRRSSPLLHEIQPPSRRLSSHQMLLLTPFGGAMPSSSFLNQSGVMGSAESDAGMMSRGSSSMGRSLGSSGAVGSFARTVPRSSSGSVPNSVPRGFSTSPSSSMTSEPSSMGMDRSVPSSSGGTSAANHNHRPQSAIRPTRHRSLVSQVNPSPLSRPMTTIPSGSSGSGSGSASHPPSREPSTSNSNTDNEDMVAELENSWGGGSTHSLEAVPMMRSNSLPVLTLRELDALREKDGELGIARGSDWAWVSRHDDEDDIGPDDLSTSPESGHFGQELPTPNTTFAFQDPFAQIGKPTLPLDDTASPSTLSPHKRSHEPVSTSEEYRYSPTNEVRRMSDAPLAWKSDSMSGVSVAGPADSLNVGKEGVRARHSIAVATNTSPRGSASREIAGHPAANAKFTPPPPPSRPGQSPRSIRQDLPRTESSGSPSTPVEFTPALSSTQFFNSRASLSAINGDGPIYNPALLAPESPRGTKQETLTRPKMLRYKTSPARFTGLGLNIVVKAVGSTITSGPNSAEPTSAKSRGSIGSNRSSGDKGTSRALAGKPLGQRRSSSRNSDETTTAGGRRISGTSTATRASASSTSGVVGEAPRRGSASSGVWANVNLVDALSNQSASFVMQRERQRSSVAVPIAESLHTRLSIGQPLKAQGHRAQVRLGSKARASLGDIRLNHAHAGGPSSTSITRSHLPRVSASSMFTVEHVSLRSANSTANDFDNTSLPSETNWNTDLDFESQSQSALVDGAGAGNDPNSTSDSKRRNTHAFAVPRNMQFSSLRGRGRWDSIDTAMQGVDLGDASGNQIGGMYGSNSTNRGAMAGLGDGSLVGLDSLTLLPRRGSLAVLTQTALGPWAEQTGVAGARAEAGVGDGAGYDHGFWAQTQGYGQKDHNAAEGQISPVGVGGRVGGGGGGEESPLSEVGEGLGALGSRMGLGGAVGGRTDLGQTALGHWQERRGSWAEGWGFK